MQISYKEGDADYGLRIKLKSGYRKRKHRKHYKGYACDTQERIVWQKKQK